MSKLCSEKATDYKNLHTTSPGPSTQTDSVASSSSEPESDVEQNTFVVAKQLVDLLMTPRPHFHDNYV